MDREEVDWVLPCRVQHLEEMPMSQLQVGAFRPVVTVTERGKADECAQTLVMDCLEQPGVIKRNIQGFSS